jgi:diguanylate cyclase (GGDEF)-like protein/PAS domain S-box-containing protein
MIPGADANQSLLVNSLIGAREGVIIVDVQHPDFPVRYVNEGFTRLTGYGSADVIGRNYRILQGTDTNQPEIALMISAIADGTGCVVKLRNYRKDGSMFRGEFSVIPLHNAQGVLTHFIGILRNATEKRQTEGQAETSAANDPLVGIANRSYFHKRFAGLLEVSQHIRSGISVLMIDLDHFNLFNERYGKAAGDECLQLVGGCIAKSFIRASDCVARYGGEEFAVVTFFPGTEALRHHAQRLCERVRELNIPHSDSPHGVVTVSIGGIFHVPNRDTTEAMLIELANQQLVAAKHSGRDQVHITGEQITA